jgi:hypothetical protein
VAKNKLYFKYHNTTGRNPAFSDRLVDAWTIEKAPDINTWSAEECLEHCNTWGIDEDAYPYDESDLSVHQIPHAPADEPADAKLARLRGLCWDHLRDSQEEFQMDIIAVVDTESLADRMLAVLNGDEPSINDPLRQYRCEVLPDGQENDDAPRTYTVQAPCPQLAQLLAFAADGGMSPIPPEPEHVLEWPGLLALAQSYTSVEETKFQP